ncbi:MAG TPA: MFS transporter [Chryseolinea sp.]|nr:MFS transporter [Chryseolinea sp.]
MDKLNKDDYRKLVSVPVIVAALGYFVDIYDLLLFGIVRVVSLKSLGVADHELLGTGESLIRFQMSGLLIGGVLWGILGDKRGRLSVLFGSILLYSLANIGNGFATSVTQYAWLRFIAGVGLAGELGAGITLVAEILPTRLRGYGTTLIASIGLLGAVFANIIAARFEWQTTYFIGGGLGLLLLLARVSVFESGVFKQMEGIDVQRGNFFQFFNNRKRVIKFLGNILIGLPIWFVIGILITFSPEFARALGIQTVISAGDSIMYCYIGLSIGDIVSGIVSQKLQSRKKVVLLYIGMTFLSMMVYLFFPFKTSFSFYLLCAVMGFCIGYWALFVTIAAEQFGTNLRATATTTVPNFVRWTVVPVTLVFEALRDNIGVINGALTVGVATIVIACGALYAIEETFSKDLNFVEED